MTETFDPQPPSLTLIEGGYHETQQEKFLAHVQHKIDELNETGDLPEGGVIISAPTTEDVFTCPVKPVHGLMERVDEMLVEARKRFDDPATESLSLNVLWHQPGQELNYYPPTADPEPEPAPTEPAVKLTLVHSDFGL